MKLAPILLFAFNRPAHLTRTLSYLAKNRLASESELKIYIDGPRHEGDATLVSEVTAISRQQKGFKEIQVVTREANLGLAKSIISGVSEAFISSDRIIVLEDDLITSPYFLDFMNDGLEKYSVEERICSIHGYSYPLQQPLPNHYFLRGGDCWGWATWRRAWKNFNPDGRALLSELTAKKLIFQFDADGSYPFTRMLKEQIQGINSSWAIRWRAATFLKNQLTLYPGRSLVQNIGFDGSGTHSDISSHYDTLLSQEKVVIQDLPIEVDPETFQKYVNFNLLSKSSLARFKYHLRRLVHKTLEVS